MKIRSGAAVLAALALAGGPARAETYSGHITQVDPGRGRIIVSSGDADLALWVRCTPLLEKLRSGMHVTLDAENAGGRLELRSIATSGAFFQAPRD